MHSRVGATPEAPACWKPDIHRRKERYHLVERIIVMKIDPHVHCYIARNNKNLKSVYYLKNIFPS